MTGNTVILRPSPLTPYSATIFGEAAVAADLPRGVLNVVIDAGHEGGVTLTRHAKVDMVTFTGSSAIGEKVAAQAAQGLKRLQLELGGKSAQIVLSDRLEAARSAALGVCLAHAGQACVLGTRVFVPTQKKTELVAQMAASLAELVIGDPSDPGTQMGPVITAAQRERCEHYVAAAVAAGGRVVAGGARPSHLKRGYYFQPTILDLPDNSNPAAQDEIFGPVVSVIGYDSIEHAVAMANDTIFGLSGYVFGKDVRQALSVAMRLRTGTVNVNSSGMSAYASSGGFGASGVGRERGLEGIRVYQQIQVMNVSN
jgi:aldehyde dehydrogenase (NAD+)